MAATSSTDTEVSVVNKKEPKCTCKCTCTYIQIPPEWAFMSQEDVNAVKATMSQTSVFCTNCLSPYSGERSSGGELILRCLRCHHVDVIKEDMLKEGEDLDLFTGDIISNRFNRILNFEKEFKKIDLHDPYNIDDDFKRLHEMHATVLKAISEATNGIRIIVDGHRMAHNMNVYRERQLLQDQLDNNTLTRKRNKREREKACIVEISGSLERNNFILDPKTFSVPENVISRLKRKGYEGVLNIDKMLLVLGLPNVFIKDNMPLYHARLQKYRDKIQCTYVPGRANTESKTCQCCVNSVNIIYKISDDEIMCEEEEENETVDVSSKENQTECEKSSNIKTGECEDDSILIKSGSEFDEIQPKKRKKHRQLSQKDNTATSAARARAQEDLFTMLECLAAPQDDPAEIDNLILSVAESSESAVAQRKSPASIDSYLDFRRHLGVTNYAEDYEEQKFVLGHLHKVQNDDVDSYNIDFVNRVCVEVVDGIRERKVAAKEERRVRIVDYLQLTSTKMCTRVDDVKDDVISQLKMAFQRRIVRNREEKERQDQMLKVKMAEKLASKDDSAGKVEKVADVSSEKDKETNEPLAVPATVAEDNGKIVEAETVK